MTDKNESVRPRAYYGDYTDVITAFIVLALIDSVMIFVGFKYDNGNQLIYVLMAMVFGSALGWVVGLILSPYDSGERAAFANVGKLVYGFLSGYFVSKMDPVVTDITRNGVTTSPGILIVATALMASFLVSGATSYISRSYWRK
jgi:hypothetical protein